MPAFCNQPLRKRKCPHFEAMETEARGQQATDPRQSRGPGVEALQEAPHGRSPYPKLVAVISFLKSMPSPAQQHRACHAPQISFPESLSVGFAPCPGPGFLSQAALGRGEQGWVPRAEHPNLQEEVVFPEVKEAHRVRAQPVGCQG